MITENLSTLKIHKLTQEQYDKAVADNTLEENALYLTPDDAEKNQNAFSVVNIDYGSNGTSISATSTTDTITLSQGDNISLDVDTNTKKITISAMIPEGSTTQMGIVQLSDEYQNAPSGTAASSTALESVFQIAKNTDQKVDDAIAQLDSKADAEHTHDIADITNLQNLLNAKQATITGAATTITSSNLDADKVLVSNSSGKVTVSDVTNTELGYLSGVTSNIQEQLDSKGGVGQNVAGKEFTVDGNDTYIAGQGAEIFNDYDGNIAYGEYSHAEGYQAQARGFASHAEGGSDHLYTTLAFGAYSHAEGLGSQSQGTASHAEGYGCTAFGDYAHVEGYRTTAYDFQHTSGKYNQDREAPTLSNTQDTTNADAIFLVGCGSSSSNLKNAFRISSGGKCFGSESFGTSGADFAELFEWSDGNPNDEDRRGLFVTLDGDKIRLANVNDDYIGVISGNEAFIGNSASEEWQGKYLTDVFGTKLSQTVEVPAEINKETGEVIREACTTTQYVLNPDYNPDEEYIMRENRKEWGIVGLLGQVVVIDDGTCVVGGYVKPSTNGIGTASDNGYRVMKRIDENHIKVLVK